MDPLHIDGSMGEGGGQVLRTAAGLAAATQVPVEITDIRANRRTSGLRPQHVAALEAVAQACHGTLEGAAVGADHVTLVPGEHEGGHVRVETETAANTLLILQALLPFAPALDEPLTVEATGGTDTKWAPTLGHLRHALIPLASKAGIQIDLLEVRHGFYPKGGGRLKVRIHPRRDPAWQAVLDDRGELEAIELSVRIAQLPDHVAQRTLAAAGKVLGTAGYETTTTIEEVEATSPGVVIDGIARYEETVLAANALGEKGLPSETIGQRCGQGLVAEMASPATVDVHAADQLVPLLYDLPGSGFVVREMTGHLETNLAVAALFLGERHRVGPKGDGTVVRFTAPASSG